MSAMTFVLKALAYDDLPPTNNPSKVGIDRNISLVNVPVENDQTNKYTLDPLQSLIVIDGTRSILQDDTTAYTLTLSPFDPTIYRLTWTGGTNPVFRVDRGLNLDGISLTLTLNANLSLTIAAGTGTPFSAVQNGDVVFIPGVSTGDLASVFDPLNEGYWSVLANGTASITVGRAPGTVFDGASQNVTPTTADAIQAFSPFGVQIGDTVDISAGFAVNTLNAYDLTAVNAKWIEFRSTLPLGLQSGIAPGTNGLIIYTAAKRYVGIEAEEEILAQFNGSTDTTCRVTPLIAGSRRFTGTLQKWGTAWKLVIVNRTTLRHTITITSAE